MFAIGVDVGGTTTRVGCVDGAGRLLGVERFTTPRSAGALLDEVAARATSLGTSHGEPSDRSAAVGIALPGPVDAVRGLLLRSVNLPFLEGYPFVDELRGRTGRAAIVYTDADAATWGEYVACRDRPRRFVHMRLGTGVACGVVIDGRLQPVAAGRTTHWDILVVEHCPDAISCACGLRGCLETIASGPALAKRWVQLGHDSGLAGLQEAFVRHEQGAVRIVADASSAIIRAVSNLRSEISGAPGDPMIVSIGGGVVSALPCLFAELAAAWSAKSERPSEVGLRLARLGDDAGVAGAAMLAAHRCAPRI